MSIYNALLLKAVENIDAISDHISFTESVREYVNENTDLKDKYNLIDAVQWRTIRHCSSVTRLYSIYESFVHQLISQHLKIISKYKKLSEMSESTCSALRNNISKVLLKIDSHRFEGVSIEKVVKNYHLALDDEYFEFEPKVMSMHDQNLRVPELNRLLSTCEIEKADEWIRNYPKIKSFLMENEDFSSDAANVLNDFIKFRNDAAHLGMSIDEILGARELILYCEFFKNFIEAIVSRFRKYEIEIMRNKGLYYPFAQVEEVHNRGKVIIFRCNGCLKKGMSFVADSKNAIYDCVISSIQLDGRNYSYVCDYRVYEAGVSGEFKLNVGDELYMPLTGG